MAKQSIKYEEQDRGKLSEYKDVLLTLRSIRR